jgi:hypothetical protein
MSAQPPRHLLHMLTAAYGTTRTSRSPLDIEAVMLTSGSK